MSHIQINPDTGEALNTTFTISVEALGNEDLLYSYFFDGDGKRTKLAIKQAASSLDVHFPAGM